MQKLNFRLIKVQDLDSLVINLTQNIVLAIYSGLNYHAQPINVKTDFKSTNDWKGLSNLRDQAKGDEEREGDESSSVGILDVLEKSTR